jgi:flagellar protein FliL
VAEEKAKAPDTAKAAEGSAGAGIAGKPAVLIALVVLNMLVVLGVGFMVWKARQTPPAAIDQVIEGEKKTQDQEAQTPEAVGKVIPLETFIVNLAGSKGRKVLKVNMELEVIGADIISEIDNRKAQIRDFIIIILSSKTYEEISTKEGKDYLRGEIRDNINTFLSKGKITNVYFTELIYN